MESCMNKLKETLDRMLSRKFLLALAGAITLMANKEWAAMVTLLLGYIAAEGGADVVDRLKNGAKVANRYINPESQNDEVDTSIITTGKPEPTPMFNEEVKE